MGSNRVPHRNKPMHVILQNGRQFIDKIVKEGARYCKFENEGRIPRTEIRSLSTHRATSS